MVDEKKPDQLEIEKIKLERLKVYGKIITVLISICIGTFGVAYINNSLQNKKLEGQLKKEEMENLGKFLSHALEEDIDKQIRFANYFAKLTISKDVQTRWEDYHSGLVDLKDKEEELEAARKIAKTEEEKGRLDIKLARVKRQTASLQTKVKITKKAGLDKNGRPLKYTENGYELKSDGQVVYDKTTGLTWQQSGSKVRKIYDEAKLHIKELNRDKFAGYNDWRLPTLKEGITLLEQVENSNRNRLFIDPVFDNKQQFIWTSDKSGASRAWVVGFWSGYCASSVFSNGYYVRAVR